MHPFTCCFGVQFRFTMYNFPNVVLGFIWMVNVVLNLVFASDLSKEYDLKAQTAKKLREEVVEDCSKNTHQMLDQRENQTEEATEASPLVKTNYQNNKTVDSLANVNDNETKNQNYGTRREESEPFSYESNEFFEHIPLIQKSTNENFEPENLVESSMSITQLFKWKEFRTMITINFMCAYISVAFFDIGLPLVCTNAFKMKVGRIGIAFSATGLSFIITLIIMTLKMNSLFANSKEKVLIVSGVTVLIIAVQSLTLSVVAISKGNSLGAYLFLALYTIALGIGWSLEQVILGVILTKMIPSHNQGYAEGIRRSVSSIAYIIAGVVTPLLGEYLKEQSFVFTGLAVVLVIYLLANRFVFEQKKI